MIKFRGGVYEDVQAFLKKAPKSDPVYVRCLQSRGRYYGAKLRCYCTLVASRAKGVTTASLLDRNLPQFIRYHGSDLVLVGKADSSARVAPEQMPDITRVATVVNYSVWDATLLQEAQKWIATQLRKRRRVFQNITDKMDFALFSTNLPSLERLRMMIARKFVGFKGKPPALREITHESQLDIEPAMDELELELDAEPESANASAELAGTGDAPK